MAGLKLPVKAGVSEQAMQAETIAAKGVLLRIAQPLGSAAAGPLAIPQSNAILRTIAEMRPDSLLYGRTGFESSQASLFSAA